MKYQGEKHTNVESTQTTLKERLRLMPDLAHGYFVSADIQTAGRGRSNHEWVSIRGNLLASILIKKIPNFEITWTPLWLSVCLHQALVNLEVEPTLLQLKWPNDLWIEESKKIGGILCEKVGDSIIAGIGVNLAESPPQIENAGSILFEAILLNDLLQSTLAQIFKTTTLVEVKAYYEKYALFVTGDWVEWTQDNRQCSGKIIGLGVHGEMLVEVDGIAQALFNENIQKIRKLN